MANQSENRTAWRWNLLLVVAVIAAYLPVWHAGFIWDDNGHVTRPGLRSLAGLGEIWFTPGATQQYYPVVHSVFWLEHQLWGDWPLPYHLLNVALLACTALLLVRVLRKLEIPGAWLAAALFALHPLQVESVAWVTELKNVLSGLFYFSAALVYLDFDRTRAKQDYFVSFTLFAFGLMSKTVIASLPAALLVVFWWKRGRVSWKTDVLPLLPFFTVGIVSGLFTAYIERRYIIGEDTTSFDYTFLERTLIAGHAIWFYLGKLAWPTGLAFIYPRWTIRVGWQLLYPASALALAGALLFLSRSWRGPLAGFLFYVGTLFPALGFFNVYPFRYSFVADHFQYLAGLGLIVPVAAGLTILADRLVPRKTALVLAAGLLLLLGAVSWQRASVFTNVDTLWSDTLVKNPACWMAYNNLGLDYFNQGDLDAAMAQYRKALAVDPQLAEPHNNLGNALVRQRRIAEAIREYETALALNPAYARAHNNLGNALLQSGRIDDAIRHYQQALAIDPRYVDAENDLGNALGQKGDWPGAITAYHEAMRMAPTDARAHDGLGNALNSSGKIDEALVEYETALRLDPTYVEAHSDLGVTLLQKGRVDEAIAQFEAALRLDPNSADTHYNLGYAFLQKGRLDDAIAHYEIVVRLEPGNASARKNLAQALALAHKAAAP